MLIYLLFFILVIGLTGVSEVILKKGNNKILFFIISSIVVFLVAAFAGVRDKTVGTDVLTYAEPILTSIEKYGLNFTMKYANVEHLYILLSYIVTLIRGNLNVLLFFIQLLILIIVYIYAYKNKNEVSITMIVAVYLFMFYGITFNLMRQSIAMFIMLYALKYIKERKLVKYIISIIIAMNFHITAVFLIFLYWLYPIFNKKDKYLYQIIIISILIFVILALKSVLEIFLNFGILPEKFSSYLGTFLFEETNFQIKASIMKIIILFFACIYINVKKNNITVDDQFAFFLIVIDFILFQAGAIISYAERISYYFSLIGYMYLIPRFLKIFKNNMSNKIGSIIILFIFLVIYWYITFVILGVSSIIPYKSVILGI